MQTAVIIQARIGSTRLPNKMITPFYQDQNLLEFLLNRLVNGGLKNQLVLAIPRLAENDVLEDIATKFNIKVIRGPENDVLQRFIEAAESVNAELIIRVCADNPFLDVSSIPFLIKFLEEKEADYAAFCLSNGTPSIKTHYGFWAEGVTLNALKKVATLTSEKVYREHVTNYIYAHPKEFTTHCHAIRKNIEQESWCRFTVDTAGDFQRMANLAKEFHDLEQINPEKIIGIASESEAIKAAMQAEIEKNSK